MIENLCEDAVRGSLTNKWHELFDDPTAADAICDRLIPTAIKLNLKGKSMRGDQKKTKEKSCTK